MNSHLVWLWVWYGLGMVSYWFKRAYYGINPPNPIATSYSHWIQRSWAPLVVRMLLEGVAYWVLFIPGIADKGLAYFGWESYGWAISVITQVTPVAFFFGHTMDSVADMAVSKIPFINNILPQMPGPLPQQTVVQAQLVTQTTHVQQLQTTTTTVPEAPKSEEGKP